MMPPSKKSRTRLLEGGPVSEKQKGRQPFARLPPLVVCDQIFRMVFDAISRSGVLAMFVGPHALRQVILAVNDLLEEGVLGRELVDDLAQASSCACRTACGVSMICTPRPFRASMSLE